MRNVYNEVSRTPTRATIQNPGEPLAALQAPQMIQSLLKAPAVTNGNPASEHPAITNVQKAKGRRVRNPPIRKILCSSCKALMTMPAARNSSALKNACVMKWKMAAGHAPTPRARNM